MSHTKYDTIGKRYNTHRCADPRITDTIQDLLRLPKGRTIADIGAGTGNYSRTMAERGYSVIAVEPSAVMYEQAASHDQVKWLRGTAEEIPMANDCVDAVICILAAHHFFSRDQAISEMCRICQRGPILWLTFDPRETEKPWLADYFPDIWNDALDAFPPLSEVTQSIDLARPGTVKVLPFFVPHDLQDCFLAAGWRRPAMYLDPEVRNCMSGFALADPSSVEHGLSRLRYDLTNEIWRQRYGHVLLQSKTDWGYRFVLAKPDDTRQTD